MGSTYVEACEVLAVIVEGVVVELDELLCSYARPPVSLVPPKFILTPM
jgi:hypothetical protein